MISQIVYYNKIAEYKEGFKTEKIVSERKPHPINLETFEKSIKFDIQYLGESLMEENRAWPRLLDVLEKKVEGHSQIVDDFIEQKFLNKRMDN